MPSWDFASFHASCEDGLSGLAFTDAGRADEPDREIGIDGDLGLSEGGVGGWACAEEGMESIEALVARSQLDEMVLEGEEVLGGGVVGEDLREIG